MLSIPLRKEIYDHQTKLVGRITLRQAVCGSVAVALMGALGLAAWALGVPMQLASWVFMVVGIPPLFLGFWRPRTGQTPERYAWLLLRHFCFNNRWTYCPEVEGLRLKEDGGVALTRQERRHARAEHE